jgi:hypothetical protein
MRMGQAQDLPHTQDWCADPCMGGTPTGRGMATAALMPLRVFGEAAVGWVVRQQGRHKTCPYGDMVAQRRHGWYANRAGTETCPYNGSIVGPWDGWYANRAGTETCPYDNT